MFYQFLCQRCTKLIIFNFYFLLKPKVLYTVCIHICRVDQRYGHDTLLLFNAHKEVYLKSIILVYTLFIEKVNLQSVEYVTV